MHRKLANLHINHKKEAKLFWRAQNNINPYPTVTATSIKKVCKLTVMFKRVTILETLFKRNITHHMLLSLDMLMSSANHVTIEDSLRG